MPINYFFFDYDNTLTANGHANELSRRLRDTINKNHTFVPTNNEIVISFGGIPRINKLRNMIKTLLKNDKKVYICSTSWYPITALQWQTYLKYIMNYLKIPFKRNHILTLPVIKGSKESQKGKTIHNVLVKNNVSYNEAIFYDDSLPNIQSGNDSLICNVSHFLIILLCICICICTGTHFFR